MIRLDSLTKRKIRKVLDTSDLYSLAGVEKQ